MAEYIEREAAIAETRKPRLTDAELRRRLAHIPAADVRPAVKGKWTMNSGFPDRLICSECGAQFDCWHWESKQMHFCPNCGADMRGEQDV
jgi:hypothetical protein